MAGRIETSGWCGSVVWLELRFASEFGPPDPKLSRSLGNGVFMAPEFNRAWSPTMKRTVDFLKPRSGKSEARRREREVALKIERLLEIADEETFKAGLDRDLGIKPDHPRFAEILSVWRNAQ
jgi:hypothetical protein